MPSLVCAWIIVMLSCMVYHSWSISKLQRIQNATARLLTGLNKFDHITPVLKSLHWVPVEKRIDFKVLLLVYHALHDQAQECMSDMLHERTNVRILRSNTVLLLLLPRDCRMLCQYLTGLKIHLFKSAFNYLQFMFLYVFVI